MKRIINAVKSFFSGLNKLYLLKTCIVALLMGALGWIRPLWLAIAIVVILIAVYELHLLIRIRGEITTAYKQEIYYCAAGIPIGLFIILLNMI
jgi:hypothetical protein